MKRLNILLGAAALIAVSLTASPSLMAQENGNKDEYGKTVRGPYETNRFADNWFIGAGGGINMLLNEGYDIKISPSIDANVGKWFTPTIGMRIGYQGFKTGAYSDSPTLLGPDLDTGKGKYLEKFGYMYIHGDFLWNMSNATGGYKQTRFWNMVPYVHAGFFRAYGLDDADYSNNELAAGAGMLHNLRLTDRLDLIIDMRTTIVNGRVHESDGVAILPSVTAGLAVDIGFPGFVRTSSVVGAIEAAYLEKTAILETAVAALEVANAALEVEAERLARTNASLNEQIGELEKEPKMDYSTFFGEMGPATLYFEIGKTELCKKELQHLDFIAKNLIEKADKNTNIYLTIMGSADGNTGSSRRNMHLSEARGKYVFDLLTSKYGISPERLIVKSEVVKKASEPALSRAVIVSF